MRKLAMITMAMVGLALAIPAFAQSTIIAAQPIGIHTATASVMPVVAKKVAAKHHHATPKKVTKPT